MSIPNKPGRGPTHRGLIPTASPGLSPNTSEAWNPSGASANPSPFLVVSKGPISLVGDPENARFREIYRYPTADYVSGFVAVRANIIPADPINFPRPASLVGDEIRIVGLVAGVRSVLMIGGTGTPQFVPAQNETGAVAYQWSAEDDGESYDEIVIEARQNIFTTDVGIGVNIGPPASNDVFIVMRLWKGR